MPPKAYHLADFDAYERVCGRRWAMYIIQPRVPVQLRLLHQRRRLRPQMERARAGAGGGGNYAIWSTRYGLELLWVVDDNFLVDRDRALGIAEGIGAHAA